MAKKIFKGIKKVAGGLAGFALGGPVGAAIGLGAQNALKKKKKAAAPVDPSQALIDEAAKKRKATGSGPILSALPRPTVSSPTILGSSYLSDRLGG